LYSSYIDIAAISIFGRSYFSMIGYWHDNVV